MADRDREAELATEFAQRIINEAREGKPPENSEETPVAAHSLQEALMLVGRMEDNNGLLCARMNTACDIILALIFNLEEEIGKSQQSSHEMMLYQLKMIGSVLADHHEAYHLLRSGIEADRENKGTP